MSNNGEQNLALVRENGQGLLLLNRRSNGFSVLLAAGIALMPKCPVCCSVYLSFLSSLGIVSFPSTKWIIPGMVALLIINLFAQGFVAKKSKSFAPLILSALGATSLVLGNLWLGSRALSWIGVALILTASCLNLVAKRRACDTATRISQS